jgi:lactose/L-arabinose transport system ATP-binding protein
MTVAENMGFGLRMTGHSKEETRTKVAEASRILKLDEYLDRKPKALSGGQRQRVAIGRAIVRGPEVFLFDEPLSNLDAELRVDMRIEIARLHKEIGATMIYVTHDQVEAMTLADKIVVLRAGRVEQIGSPMDLYEDPDNMFVAGFIGSPAMNFLEGTVAGPGAVRIPALGDRLLSTKVALPGQGSRVQVGLRPQHLSIGPAEGETGILLDIRERLGAVSYDYLIAPGDLKIIVETRDLRGVPEGSPVSLDFDDRDALVFAADTGRRLR